MHYHVEIHRHSVKPLNYVQQENGLLCSTEVGSVALYPVSIREIFVTIETIANHL